MKLFEVVGYEERYILSHDDKAAETFKQDCRAAAEAIFEREAHEELAGGPSSLPMWAWANDVAEWLCANRGYTEIRAPRECIVHDATELLHPDEVARRARRA